LLGFVILNLVVNSDGDEKEKSIIVIKCHHQA
jgi:hypothetical protein